MPVVSFLDAKNNSYELGIMATTKQNFNDSILKIEFKTGDQVQNFKGVFVYSPHKGDAVMIAFSGNKHLSEKLIPILKSGRIEVGDRMIFDNLEELGSKKRIPVIVVNW